MLIDFHTHVFPEKIAAATIDKLEKMSQRTGANVKACTDGTLEGLKAAMRQNGVDYSVVLPVMTRPEQFDSVNRYAAKINGNDGIFSFGGIHPDCDAPEAKLDQLKAMGLRGIKLHPDYQGTRINDPRYLRILRHCNKIGLYATLHSGIDIGFPDDVMCPPEEARRMLETLWMDGKPEQPQIILAHLGAFGQWDAVEKYLVGEPVYFDLAFTFRKASPEQIRRIIRAHGAEKILFATDSPWSDPGLDFAGLKALELSDCEMEQICSRNARKILEI